MNISRYFTADDTKSMPMGIGYESYNTNYWQRLCSATTAEQLKQVADEINEECKNNPMHYMEFAVCIRYIYYRICGTPLDEARRMIADYVWTMPVYDRITDKIIDNWVDRAAKHTFCMEFVRRAKQNGCDATYLTADGSNDELGVLLVYHTELEREWLIRYIDCCLRDDVVCIDYEDCPQWYVDMCNASGCRCMYGCMDVRFRI